MTDRPITKVELAAVGSGLVYLATSYTKCVLGFEQAAAKAARIAAALAQATHGAVFSPIAHSHALATAGGLDPVKDNIAWQPLNDIMLIHADALVVVHMEGWQESAGIAEEIAFFEHAGKPIFDLVDLDRLSMVRRLPQKPARDRYDCKVIGLDDLEAKKREFLEHAPRS